MYHVSGTSSVRSIVHKQVRACPMRRENQAQDAISGDNRPYPRLRLLRSCAVLIGWHPRRSRGLHRVRFVVVEWTDHAILSRRLATRFPVRELRAFGIRTVRTPRASCIHTKETPIPSRRQVDLSCSLSCFLSSICAIFFHLHCLALLTGR